MSGLYIQVTIYTSCILGIFDSILCKNIKGNCI